jgi:hypothetical protein
MAGNLRACVDCGNLLSVTAKSCGKCNSTDPFGVDRAAQKTQLTLFLLGLMVVGVIAALFYFQIIDQNTLKNLLHKNG